MFHTHSSAVLGSSLRTLTLPAAWRQVSSISIHLAHSRVHSARDLHVTASAQSKCLSVTRSAHSLLCLRHGGRFHLTRIIRRLHGSRSEWVASEICVLCLGQFVLLARQLCHQRVDWLASENDLQRDVCALLGPAGLAHVRSVLSAVSSVRDPVVKR